MNEFTFLVPDVAEGIAEVTIVRWFVATGAEVLLDAPLVEIETDKSLVEIGAPCAGRLIARGADEGELIDVGQILARFETDRLPADVPHGRAAGGSISSRGDESTGGRDGQILGSARRTVAAPATRRRAQQLGIDLATVRATGPGGRVTLDDLDRVLHDRDGGTALVTPPHIADNAGDVVIPLTTIRRGIAEAMTRSAAIPTIHEWRDVDMSALLRAREGLKDAQGGRPSLLALMVRAVVVAVHVQPSMCSTFDAAASALTIRRSIDVGIATSTADGLLVPVLTGCAARSLADLDLRATELVHRARCGRLEVGEQRPAGITVSNYGSLGTRRGAPMLRPPEVAIVGFGAVHDAVRATSGGIAVRPVMEVSVGTDHRVHDGSHLANFAAALEQALSEPQWLIGQRGSGDPAALAEFLTSRS